MTGENHTALQTYKSNFIKSIKILFVWYCTNYHTGIHLYSMNKKVFHSQLFRRKIEVFEQDYWSIVYGETLFRIDDLEFRKCPCFKCTQDLEIYKDLLTRLRSASLLPQNKEP